MIKPSMFYTEPTLNDYREIEPEKIIREHLLTEGTRRKTFEEDVIEINKEVCPKDLVNSGLFVYGLKANQTNKKAIEYYVERWARRNLLYRSNKTIVVPKELWEQCDKENYEFTKGKDREI